MRVCTSRLLCAVLLAGIPASASAEVGAPKVVEFSGFVDTSLVIPMTGFAKDDDSVSFGLDEVELDIVARPAAGLTLRTDLNWRPSLDVLGDVDLTEPSLFAFDNIVEQGYAKYIFGGGERGFFFQAGKKNAPVGSEAVDAPDIFQYSHSLLFDHASPTNLTGFFLGFDHGGAGFGGQVWMSNAWDKSTTPGNPSFGGRAEYAFESGGVGIATSIGPVRDDAIFFMVDADAHVKAGLFTGLLDANVASVDGELGFGVSAAGNVAIGDSMSATARVSYLDRAKLGAGQGDPYKGVEATAAYLFTFTDHFGGLLEVRLDKEDGKNLTVGGAFEATATF